jgi:hypothetical protein
MSDKSSNQEGDIFDDVESIESDGRNSKLLNKNFMDDKDLFSLNNQDQLNRCNDNTDYPHVEIIIDPGIAKNTVVVMSHIAKKQQNGDMPSALLRL